jgi:hypothetical protein
LTSQQTAEPDTEGRRLCFQCVGERFLREEIEERGDIGVCFNCGNERQTFSVGAMADAIDTAFKEHFCRPPIDPSDDDYAMTSEDGRERKGDPIAHVISSAAGIEPKLAEDIRVVLSKRHFDRELAKVGEENAFDESAHYVKKGANDYDSKSITAWLYFEHSLKTQARYFSRSAQESLTSIFKGIDDHKTSDGRPVIVEAGPERQLAAIYRARVFQSYEKLDQALRRPDEEIGPPPPALAVNGRMNAHGIAVFYAATEPSIALAEVRPPVGSRVVVGRFELIRTIRLLDIEALRSLNVEGSIFDRDYIQRLKRAKFLKWLSRRITRPVMPDDEPFEYLATQAIADFLATDADPPLDGILYPSMQASESGFNVVLFHGAARVEPMQIPKGTEISPVVIDTEQVTDYTVTEETPLDDSSSTSERQNIPFFAKRFSALRPGAYEPREPALRLDVATLQVHHVNSVVFETDAHSVNRLRIPKRREDQGVEVDR